jgi:Fe-S-cluster containining protein
MQAMTDADPPLTPEQSDLVARQAQRWQDPATRLGAQQRVLQAQEQARHDEGRLRAQLRQLEKAPGIRHKIYWLREMAATFADAVAPQAACRTGCAACCFQPVQVTQQEAEVIARETGARMQTPPAFSNEPGMQYVGRACSFLDDSRCTIYEHRPMACRLMFNMDVDALLCQMVPGALSHVPYADYSDHKEVYVRAHLGRVKNQDDMQAALQALRMADLREFFPQGRKG